MNERDLFIAFDKAPLVFIAVFLLIVSARRWRWASRLYGRVPLKFGFAVLGWTLRSGTRYIFLLILIGMAASIFVAMYSPYLSQGWLVCVFPVVLFLLSQIVGYSTPPSLLLLGSSHPDTAELLALLHARCSRYRAVALLHSGAAAGMSPVDRINFNGNNLRIAGKHDWRKVVFPIANEVPLIILDTRYSNNSVAEESGRLLADSSLYFKTIFLVCDDGSAPSIEGLEEWSSIPPGMRKCTVAELVPQISRFVTEKLQHETGLNNG